MDPDSHPNPLPLSHATLTKPIGDIHPDPNLDREPDGHIHFHGDADPIPFHITHLAYRESDAQPDSDAPHNHPHLPTRGVTDSDPTDPQPFSRSIPNTLGNRDPLPFAYRFPPTQPDPDPPADQDGDLDRATQNRRV